MASFFKGEGVSGETGLTKIMKLTHLFPDPVAPKVICRKIYLPSSLKFFSNRRCCRRSNANPKRRRLLFAQLRFMKILVTGATGNVGSQVSIHLAKAGVPVVVGVRDVEKAKRYFAGFHNLPPVEFQPFDYADPSTWYTALAGVGKIFLVVPPGTTDSSQVSLFFKTALDAGVLHLAFNSGRTTGDLDEEPLHVTEGLVRNSGIDWTIFRPGWFMQNFLNWVGFTIPSENAFYLPAADAKTAFVDVRDIGACVAKALTDPGHGGKLYELTSSEALTHYEVAQKISEVAGRTIRYVHLSDEEFIKEMVSRGWKQAAAEHTVFLYRIVRTGKEAAISHAVEDLLSRKPIDFTQFAKDHAAGWERA
jgi:uncharacterized protein YbjT (DUF2867 family)